MRGLASVLAADTREPRLCAALRAYAVPSAGHDFMMQPHEDPLPPLGFLDFEQRGQFEARQAGVASLSGCWKSAPASMSGDTPVRCASVSGKT